jgi:ABC-2 type transport system permease protein
MSWQAVARKDFADSIRSWWLWGLSAAFVLLVSGAAFALGWLLNSQVTSEALINTLNGSLVTLVVPLIALVMAYGAVVGERESGSLKLLLALPHSRAEVVLGKVLGRAGAITVPIVVGFLLPAVVLLVVAASFNLLTYVGYTLLVAVLGTVFVAISVGFSAAASSQRVAIAGAVGFYFLAVGLWGTIQIPLRFLLLGGYPQGLGWIPLAPQDFLLLLRLVNPTGAFKILTQGFLGGALFAPDLRMLHVAALSMLVTWTLVPPLLGLWRFEAADL